MSMLVYTAAGNGEASAFRRSGALSCVAAFAPLHVSAPQVVEAVLRSSGHTVVVSGCTLAACFFGLCVFPFSALRSAGLGSAIAILATVRVPGRGGAALPAAARDPRTLRHAVLSRTEPEKPPLLVAVGLGADGDVCGCPRTKKPEHSATNSPHWCRGTDMLLDVVLGRSR